MKKVFPFVAVLFLWFWPSQAQKGQRLEEQLWEAVGGRVDVSKDNGGRYDIIDDAGNGYLKVAFTEDGCGCYSETTVAGYRQVNGEYALLKTHWDGCGNTKSVTTNGDLSALLPEDFGIHTFLPKSRETEYQTTSSVFYLEAEIPRKGTDTRFDLTYIPFGIHMAQEDHVLTYEYKQINGHGGTNYIYSGALQNMLRKISDESTLECILAGEPGNMNPEDKKIIDKLYGEGKDYRSWDTLAVQIHELKRIYEISQDIEFKAIILGWNRDKARFFVKEKVENDTPEMSFLEFVRQLPFLTAIC